jgi:hypothetical protein
LFGQVEDRCGEEVQEGSECRGDNLETSSVAEKSFRALKGYRVLQDVYEEKEFIDGVMKQKSKVLERMAV